MRFKKQVPNRFFERTEWNVGFHDVLAKSFHTKLKAFTADIHERRADPRFIRVRLAGTGPREIPALRKDITRKDYRSHEIHSSFKSVKKRSITHPNQEDKRWDFVVMVVTGNSFCDRTTLKRLIFDTDFVQHLRQLTTYLTDHIITFVSLDT